MHIFARCKEKEGEVHCNELTIFLLRYCYLILINVVLGDEHSMNMMKERRIWAAQAETNQKSCPAKINGLPP